MQVVVEEVEVQRELFYTEGEDSLVEARKAIAAWSLPRAAARIAAAKQLRQSGLEVLQVWGPGVWGCGCALHAVRIIWAIASRGAGMWRLVLNNSC